MLARLFVFCSTLLLFCAPPAPAQGDDDMTTRSPFGREVLGPPNAFPGALPPPPHRDISELRDREIAFRDAQLPNDGSYIPVVSLNQPHGAVDVYVAFDLPAGATPGFVIGKIFAHSGLTRSLVEMGEVVAGPLASAAALQAFSTGVRVVSSRVSAEKFDVEVTANFGVAQVKAHVAAIGSEESSPPANPTRSTIQNWANAVSVTSTVTRLARVRATNTSAGPLFFQVFDKATVPVAGDTATDVFELASGTTVSWDYRTGGVGGLWLFAGLGAAWSSTPATFTAPAAGGVCVFELAGE